MDPADAARKTRIVTHMNNDHTRELTHYLRHYAHLSASAASQPLMRDVDLQGMRISAHGKDYTIPFKPALESWAEVKGRIIEMDTIARENLGISDIYITEYAWPEGFEILVFGAVTFYYFCSALLPWVVPGSLIWTLLEAGFPGGPIWFRWIVKVIFMPVIAIHLVECFIFNNKLHRHGVDRASTGNLWWKWQLSCYIEGFGCFKRTGRIIAKKTAEKNAKK